MSTATTISDRLRNLLSRFHSVAQTSDSQWEARCPAHDDNRASLCIGIIGSGIGVYCQAGCDTDAVLATVGLKMADLFAEQPNHTGHEPRGEIVATYDYHDADGTLLFQVARFEPKDFRQRKPDGKGGWDWSVKGVKVVPYNLPSITAADLAATIFICEGEKDCDRLAALGLVVTCNAGGASIKSAKNPKPSCKWRKAHAAYLTGRNVVVIPDCDDAGRDHADGVARSLYGKATSLKILELPGLPPKGDVSDWLDGVDGGSGGTAEQLLELASQAAAWVPTQHRPASDARIVGSHLTDMGNSERFAAQHGGNVRYCYAWNSWLAWDGTRWVVDSMGEIERLAKQTVLQIYHEATAEEINQAERKEICKWAHDSQRASALRAMISLARSQQPIPIAVDSLDAEPWLLNCENGTIDLATGQLREHRQEDCLTKRCPVEYPHEPGDEPLLWLEFLDRIFAGNSALIGFVQRLMGLSLVGKTYEHILPIFWGLGANGKTTLLETWAGILGGDYAMSAPPGLMTLKKFDGHPTELASLHGKRLVSVEETPDGGRLSENSVKMLTGGSAIEARRMREDFWRFEPSHTFVIATNHRPIIKGTDNGIWRRVQLVPFTVTIPANERDAHLKEKLQREFSAILRWAVDGCLAWQRSGLQEPADVSEATEEYRSTSDVLGSFIESCCLIGPQYRVQSSLLYGYYKQWCEVNGEFVETQTKFSTRLKDRGFKSVRGHVIWWHGITNMEVTGDREVQAA